MTDEKRQEFIDKFCDVEEESILFYKRDYAKDVLSWIDAYVKEEREKVVNEITEFIKDNSDNELIPVPYRSLLQRVLNTTADMINEKYLTSKKGDK